MAGGSSRPAARSIAAKSNKELQTESLTKIAELLSFDTIASFLDWLQSAGFKPFYDFYQEHARGKNARPSHYYKLIDQISLKPEA